MTPDFSDRPRFSMMELIMPIFVGWLLIQALTGGGVLPFLFALGGGAYLFYTRHRRYELFEDALVIRFLAPRTLVIYLSEIESVRLLKQPMVGPVLLIQRKAGARVIIKPTDYEGFDSRLSAAIGR